MIYLLGIIIIGILLYYYKKREEGLIEETLTMLTSIRNKKEITDVSEVLKEEYKETLKQVIKQDLELTNSIDELKEYREELEVTYNSLVRQSNQLEYSNQILERRVESLSDLNYLSRAVLSSMDLDKTIDTIMDAYFVLTAAKRTSLYLWEGSNLINKRTKGKCSFNDSLFYEPEVFKSFNKNDFEQIYNELSKRFMVLPDEVIVISPLVVKEKELGVIYVIEDRDRLLDVDEATISALVIQVSVAINNAKMHSELLIKERISNELDVASRIQRKILPPDVSGIFGLEIAKFFDPAKEIGGDYYDYTQLDENIFSLTIADVSGKGVPAAFLMALGRSVLRTLTLTGDFEPNVNLRQLNKIIYPDITEDMFITMIHSKYDRRSKTLYYSNAGHTPILVYRAATAEIENHSVKGVAIGFLEDYSYREGQIHLNKDDVVLLYTDGITETENPYKQLFGTQRLEEVMKNNHDKSVEGIRQSILDALADFRQGYEQTDDVTFVVLKNTE